MLHIRPRMEPEWAPAPKTRRERRAHPSDGGPVMAMAVADGYVLARRPGKLPFIVAEREWRTWPVATKPCR